ncbi:hypothetical protein [Reinekea marinisedimentorum]|uniref:Uncharacterized protein n=1 Tax=Reinekea marinisedimentorum TaxID=230495 RepID=A0A4R3I7T2_9GAMM|nr:hypothetical protein [Reinekea marinisedimentorum]TCS40991.1 hypothetical protein BCF53_1074 [Reinekea marinisedimentorum]
MNIPMWIFLYAATTLWWKWIISWGGAKWLEGWKSFFLVEWFAWGWRAEQIRFHAVVIWVLSTLWFLVGLFIPDVRGIGLLL